MISILLIPRANVIKNLVSPSSAKCVNQSGLVHTLFLVNPFEK